jgi:hypothetical protein
MVYPSTTPSVAVQGVAIYIASSADLKGCMVQGCWRIERSLNRGLDRCRGLGLGRPFFSDSCSKLEIDAAFRISHKLGLGLTAKFSKAFVIQLDRFRGHTHPAHQPTPPKNLDLCVSQGSLDYLVSWRGPPPIPLSPPPHPPPLSPPPLSPHPTYLIFPTFSESETIFQRQ